MRNIIVVSASSDIGAALCRSWNQSGNRVMGTYRTFSPLVQELQKQMPFVHCDLDDPTSLQAACQELTHQMPVWDVLVFSPGLMDPIGCFEKVDFNAWEKAVQINLLRPLEMLHRLLPYRNRQQRPTVLFFSGAGTNQAAPRYSAYAVSKIALIKMCELLDAEIPDTRFSILGPGWVKTKIHQSTLKAGQEQAGSNYQRTLQQLAGNEWTSMEQVIDCCNWVIQSPCVGINGRNFSVVFDRWGTKELEEALQQDADMYKLRRNKNSWKAE